MTDFLLQADRLRDPEDLDALLELAAHTRTLADSRQYDALAQLLESLVAQGCFEGLTWVLEILQECYDRSDGFRGFSCTLGRTIPDYDDFIRILEIDFGTVKNDVEQILDQHREVQSFYNILTYPTRYPNLFLVSLENFDTKDNDFIDYRLVFEQTLN